MTVLKTGESGESGGVIRPSMRDSTSLPTRLHKPPKSGSFSYPRRRRSNADVANRGIRGIRGEDPVRACMTPQAPQVYSYILCLP